MQEDTVLPLDQQLEVLLLTLLLLDVLPVLVILLMTWFCFYRYCCLC
jgi:hypothetical protein